MADKWLSHYYPPGDIESSWFPDELEDREVIRVHLVELALRFENSTSAIQRYADWAALTRPVDASAEGAIVPRDWPRLYGPELLACISIHLNWDYGDGSLMRAHEKHVWRFPIPHDCFGVCSCWVCPGGANQVYLAAVRINYEKVMLSEQDYEVLLARNSWKINSRLPARTPPQPSPYD